MTQELKKPVTKIQAILWGALMDARFKKTDMLEILDETLEHISGEYWLFEYNLSRKYNEKRSTQ